jgi:glycerol-3-phosphate dehydrogenase (NAD(P)+)
VIEGIPATSAAVALGERYAIDLPVCTAVHRVISEHASVRDAVTELMSREATTELPATQPR